MQSKQSRILPFLFAVTDRFCVGKGVSSLPKAVRGHATSHSTRIDGIVLKIMFLVKHVKVRAWYVCGHTMEMVARKMSSTDFGTETPSK